MSHNSFSGSLPRTLRHLTLLETLFLGGNGLTGTFDMLAELTNLQELAVNSNKLTGTIPTELGDLLSLERLELQDNSLYGQLPLEICSLREWFSLGDIFVDCAEVSCDCFCVCYSDQPINT